MLRRAITDSRRGNSGSEENELPIPALALVVLLLLAGAPNALALSNPIELGKFHGVWLGNSLIAEKHPRGHVLTARDIDVAIRQTKAVLELTWKPLSQEGARRTRARLVIASKPHFFTVTHVDPPLRSKETLWAQMEGDSLVVYLSSFGNDGLERVARYELSVSDGQMRYRYTLSQDGDLLESVKGSLSRAKVVL